MWLFSPPPLLGRTQDDEKQQTTGCMKVNTKKCTTGDVKERLAMEEKDVTVAVGETNK